LARERIDSITQEVVKLAKKVGIPALLEEQTELRTVLDAHVVEKGSFESETWQATRVQAHRRTWDVDVLRKKLTPALFKRVINVTVNAAAIDELVRAEKIKLADIKDALTETPNKPYPKWTQKGKDVQESGEAEADKLAAMLG
jgi:ribosomal protein S10